MISEISSSVQCSETFVEAFRSGYAGCHGSCDCGRMFFDGSDNGWDWEDGELEGLRDKAKEDPEHYIECNYAIESMEIAGQIIIYGCSCDLARKYESFILNHDEQLAKYLNSRAAQLRMIASATEVKG